MIPIGATVRWRIDVDRRGDPIGVATARRPGLSSDMIEIDRRDWWVSEGILEVVGEMNEHEAAAITLQMTQEQLTAAVAERDALRELVAMQATTIAEQAQEVKRMRDSWTRAAARAEEYANEIERLEEFEQVAKDAATYVEDLLLAFMGERRPVRPIEPPELRRLAEFVFEGV